MQKRGKRGRMLRGRAQPSTPNAPIRSHLETPWFIYLQVYGKYFRLGVVKFAPEGPLMGALIWTTSGQGESQAAHPQPCTHPTLLPCVPSYGTKVPSLGRCPNRRRH